MSDEFISSMKWIEETRKKFTYFTSPVACLTQSLNLLEKSCFESNSLRESLVELKQDLVEAPEIITYQKNELIAWIDEVLTSSKKTKPT